MPREKFCPRWANPNSTFEERQRTCVYAFNPCRAQPIYIESNLQKFKLISWELTVNLSAGHDRVPYDHHIIDLHTFLHNCVITFIQCFLNGMYRERVNVFTVSVAFPFDVCKCAHQVIKLHRAAKT